MTHTQRQVFNEHKAIILKEIGGECDKDIGDKLLECMEYSMQAFKSGNIALALYWFGMVSQLRVDCNLLDYMKFQRYIAVFCTFYNIKFETYKYVINAVIGHKELY